MKPLNFVFGFADIKGLYDFDGSTIYVFGSMTPEETVDVLVHESLHYALHKAIGNYASLCLDNIKEELIFG